MFGYFQAFYERIFDTFGRDEFTTLVFGTFLVTFITVWVLSGLFAIVDLYQWPRWMLKYKIQPGTNSPVDQAKLWKAVKVALINTVILNISVSIIIFPLQKRNRVSADPGDFPSLWRMIRDIIVYILIEEVGFYYTHRLVHYGPLYKAIHKQHHEWTAPVGIVSHYAHPLEHLLSQSLPFESGPILCGSHVWTIWVYTLIGMAVTVVHHSGYHVPFLDSGEFHDYHHLKFNVNYGGMGWLDKLHGTDHQFRGTVEEERHCTFYSLTKSIRDIIPDRPPKTINDKNS